MKTNQPSRYAGLTSNRKTKPYIHAKLCKSIVGLLIVASHCFAQNTITVTFDSPPTSPGSGISATNYIERGVQFTGDFARRGSTGDGLWPTNATSYIQPPWGPVSITRVDNTAFDLVSADLAIYSSVFLPDETASFSGYRVDGLLVTTNFDVFGLEFQPYNFSADWINLTNVTVVAGSLDNLVIQVHPSPPKIAAAFYTFHSSTPPYGIDHEVGYNLPLIPGLKYRLDQTTALNPANWQLFITFTNSIATNFSWIDHPPSGQKFYRATILP